MMSNAAAATTAAIFPSTAFPLAAFAFAFVSGFPATTTASAAHIFCMFFHTVGLPWPPRPSSDGGSIPEPLAIIGHGTTLAVAVVVRAEEGPGSYPRLERSLVALANALSRPCTASPSGMMPERFLAAAARNCAFVPATK